LLPSELEAEDLWREEKKRLLKTIFVGRREGVPSNRWWGRVAAH
jgi:hypothetical protein